MGIKLSMLDLQLTEANYTVAKRLLTVLVHRIAQLFRQQQSVRSNWFCFLDWREVKTVGQALSPRACLSWIGEKGARKVPSSGLSDVMVG